MIQHQRHPHLVEWPLATSDPGDAATSRGLASIGGADVQTLPDDHPVAIILAHHVETCELGPRVCRDCAMYRDKAAQGALAVAILEHAHIAPWISRHPDACTYCGMWAEHRDHLVPRPWTGNAIRRRVPTVPSCADCNVRICDAHVFTIAGRADVVAASIRRKWGRELTIPDRTDEQLNEFTGGMRSRIAAAQARRQIVRRRLIVLDSGGAPFVPDALVIAA